jgi:hypothetical protein
MQYKSPAIYQSYCPNAPYSIATIELINVKNAKNVPIREKYTNTRKAALVFDYFTYTSPYICTEQRQPICITAFAVLGKTFHV